MAISKARKTNQPRSGPLSLQQCTPVRHQLGQRRHRHNRTGSEPPRDRPASRSHKHGWRPYNPTTLDMPPPPSCWRLQHTRGTRGKRTNSRFPPPTPMDSVASRLTPRAHYLPSGGTKAGSHQKPQPPRCRLLGSTASSNGSTLLLTTPSGSRPSFGTLPTVYLCSKGDARACARAGRGR